ncbi:MAG TPA: rRNA maturation RNase YbeY [Planctomycetota bacterium]|nr:rRNA maturation RNase YbeY [Planctomycetota bacterium]
MAVEILNKQRRMKLDRREIAALARNTLDAEGASGDVSIVFAGRRTITELNRRYFGKDTETDVIAFPLHDSLPGDRDFLGEVVVCTHVAIDEAARRKLDAKDELYLYVAHGLLHLLGHDDDTPERRRKMNARARAIVRSIRK